MRSSLLPILLLSITFPAAAAAAAVRGRVEDPEGKPVFNARVELEAAAGGAAFVTSTLSDGEFHFPAVTAGPYTLCIKAIDFAEQRVPVRAGDTAEPLRVVLSVIAPMYSKVTVTASRGSAEDLEIAPQLTTSKLREEFQSRPVPTVLHSLEGSAGVSVQETTYGQASPYLRGLTGYQVLALIDGIRFNTSIFRSGPNQYLAFVQPAVVDRVEAVMGPAGATFGSDSMGGTINFLTVEPRLAGKQEKPWQAEIATSGSSADLSADWRATVSGGTGRLGYVLGGSSHHHNNLRTGGAEDSHNAFRRYFGLDAAQVRDVLGSRLADTSWSQAAANGKGIFRISPSQLLTAWYQHNSLAGVRSYRDQLGGPGRVISTFDPQGLNFGYVRYEKQQLGRLDTLSGTFSVNSQQDGGRRGGLKHTDPVTTDESRIDVYGYSAQGTSHAGGRHAMVFGADLYRERVLSRRFVTDPVSGTATQQRAQYPDDSSYSTAAAFFQDTAEFLRGRLRVTGGLRATRIGFHARADRNRAASGAPLGVVNSDRSFSDLTFNTSAVWQIHKHVSWNVLVGRGFRAPNLNDLGSIGLSSLVYDVPAEDLSGLNALFAVDAGDTSGSSFKRVSRLKAERLFNYETGFALRSGRVYLRAHIFDAELLDPISSRTILFPEASFPGTVAGVAVTPVSQSAIQRQQGVVAAVSGFSPRALKTTVNDGHAKYWGTEETLRFRVSPQWTLEANYSFLVGRELNPNRPVRRLPPQQGMTSLRYAPARRGFWFEVATRLAGAQERLSGGDIDDDRQGASRRRQDIADFFSGGIVRPYLSAGGDGRVGTADDVFVPTGETLLQIQNRVLPLGATINGVLVASNGARIPLFVRNPGWATVDVRGGAPIGKLDAVFALTNLLDRNYRVYGSGVDSPGINAFLGLRYRF